MILMISSRKRVAEELGHRLKELGQVLQHIDPKSGDPASALYNPELSAVISEDEIHSANESMWSDLLNGVARRLPVLVFAGNVRRNVVLLHRRTRPELSDAVTVIEHVDVDTILAFLEMAGVLQMRDRSKRTDRTVGYYNPHVAMKMLLENKGLAVLTIDTSSFRKIEVEYGREVYQKVREVFQSVLHDLWGRPGCFRSDDVLCRRSDHSNQYYIFLNKSRSTGGLALPGVLEKIADRLNRIILQALWSDCQASAKERRLPHCISHVPQVVIGYATVLQNPCLDPAELVTALLENSSHLAQIQNVRTRDRLKELVHTLIQSEGLLYPNYQAVFKLPGLTQKMVKDAANEKSIAPLTAQLYGFESLIRVRVEAARTLLAGTDAILDPKFLRPDVLFATAKTCNVALELDQACFKLGITGAKLLPGFLMVNVLPRNLYYLERILDSIDLRPQIVLEVSESEGIANLDLFDEVRRKIYARNMLIAADDFGKAFAGLDRVIKIKPSLIKFDRSLIQDIHSDPVKQAYVSGLVQSARLIHTTVLAEGVEKWEEAEVLQRMGIDLIQGFLLHRPTDAAKILEQLGESEDGKTADKNLNSVA